MTKITSAVALTYSIDALRKFDPEAVGVIDKLTAMLAQVEKASNTPSKPSPKTIENSSLKMEIMGILSNEAIPMTIPQIVSAVTGEYSDPVTNGRVSALLTQLKNANMVERTEVKRIAHFAVKQGE